MNNHNNYVHFNRFINQNNFPLYGQQQLSHFMWNGCDGLNQRELLDLFYPNNNFMFLKDQGQYNGYNNVYQKIFDFKKRASNVREEKIVENDESKGDKEQKSEQ